MSSLVWIDLSVLAITLDAVRAECRAAYADGADSRARRLQAELDALNCQRDQLIGSLYAGVPELVA